MFLGGCQGCFDYADCKICIGITKSSNVLTQESEVYFDKDRDGVKRPISDKSNAEEKPHLVE